ncbi:MAG: hypothetical protein E6I91_15445 [Chloroflexi bacterium]|nr:MAG: hypothetical protein E6I91_15445 [Chloroflexota bacterium]
MSQQRMDYDEGSHQQQEPPYGNYETGYKDPFMGSYAGQKLSSQQGLGSSNTPAGMRLALAIVSVAVLIPLSAIILTTSGGSIFSGGLIALGLVCLTIMIVNVAFNLSFRR